MMMITDPTTLAMLGPPPQRVEGFRFDLIGLDGFVYTTVNPAHDSTVSIAHDTTQSIMRSMSNVVLPPGQWEGINLREQLLRPVWLLDGCPEIPLGEYVFGDVSRQVITDDGELHTTMQDKTSFIDQPTDTTYSWPTGTAIDSIILQVLSTIPALRQRWVVDTTGAVLTAPASYPIGTSKLQILVGLCPPGGLNPPWFDAFGWLQLRKAVDVTTLVPLLQYSINDGNIIAGSLADSDNALTAPNRWIVTSSQSTDTPLVGLYDLPATLPGSFSDLGYRVVETQSVDNLTDQASADLAAWAIAQASASVLDTISWSSTFDPRHEAFDAVSVDKGDGLLTYTEVGWAIDLTAGGEMKHTARRSFPRVI